MGYFAGGYVEIALVLKLNGVRDILGMPRLQHAQSRLSSATSPPSAISARIPAELVSAVADIFKTSKSLAVSDSGTLVKRIKVGLSQNPLQVHVSVSWNVSQTVFWRDSLQEFEDLNSARTLKGRLMFPINPISTSSKDVLHLEMETRKGSRRLATSGSAALQQVTFQMRGTGH